MKVWGPMHCVRTSCAITNTNIIDPDLTVAWDEQHIKQNRQNPDMSWCSDTLALLWNALAVSVLKFACFVKSFVLFCSFVISFCKTLPRCWTQMPVAVPKVHVQAPARSLCGWRCKRCRHLFPAEASLVSMSEMFLEVTQGKKNSERPVEGLVSEETAHEPTQKDMLWWVRHSKTLSDLIPSCTRSPSKSPQASCPLAQHEPERLSCQLGFRMVQSKSVQDICAEKNEFEGFRTTSLHHTA